MGQDKLNYVEGFGWELITDLDISKVVPPIYFDRKLRKFYTKEEILKKRIRIDTDFFIVYTLSLKKE